MAKLIVRFPNNEIREIEFNTPVYKIGKAPDNDLVLDNEDIADHQAVIETDKGVFTLVDVSENKSTKINGKQIKRENITYGDRISLGPIVVLFYPSKNTGGLSDKVKMVLYISAGALIIIVSIILIFLLITPKISSSVTKSIGGTYLEGPGKVAVVKKNKESVSKVIKNKVNEGLKKGYQINSKSTKDQKQVATEKEKRSPTFLSRFLSIFRHSANVSLPKLSEEEIANRRSVAVPHGLRRLFFRKVVVYVNMPVEVRNKSEIGKNINNLKSKKKGEQPNSTKLVEKKASPKQIVEKEKVTEEVEKKSGILHTIASPFTKLYRTIFKKKTTEEKEVIPQATQEKTPGIKQEVVGTEKEITPTKVGIAKQKKVKPLVQKKAIAEIVNPLEEINKIELSQVKSRMPEETPIYSAEELKKIERGNLFKAIKLSDKESTGAELLWKYPSAIGAKPPGKVIYCGTVSNINEDKYPDFIFTTRDGKLISVDGKHGEDILNIDMKGSVYNPVVTNVKGKSANILVIYKKGKIESYSKALDKKWFTIEDHPITALPVLTDVNGDKIDDVIVATLGMDIVAVDGKSGFEIWRFSDLTGEVDTAPVAIDVNNDSILDIVVSSVAGYINVIDGKTGWGLWERKIYGRPAGPPLIADLDGDGTDEIVSLTRNGILTSYSLDGKNLFTNDLGKNFIIPPSAGDVDNNGKVDLVFMSTDGFVEAIEGKTRRILWTFESEERTSFGRIALADMNMDKALDVIFTTPSGLIYILDGKSGTPLSIFNTEDFILAAPTIYDFSRDKIPDVIVPTFNGNLFCIRVSAVKKHLLYMKKSYWPSENHDIRNSGFSELKSNLVFWK